MSKIAISLALGMSVASSVGQGFSSVESKLTKLDQKSKKIKLLKGHSHTVAELGKQLKQYNSVVDKSVGVNAELDQYINETERAYRRAGGELKKYGVSLKNAEKKQRQFNRALKDQAKIKVSLQKHQQNKQIRQQLSGQFQGAALQGATIAIDFEFEMSKLGALGSLDKTSAEFKSLQATAEELGKTTVWSAKESAQGMQYLSMARFKTNQTIAAMPGMLSLASAGNMDLASTADIASNILSGFSKEAVEMGRVSNVLAKTATSSNTNLRMLGETMKYVAPAARDAKVSLEETAAMAGLLGNIGIQGSMAGTALKSIFQRMASPPTEAKKALKDLGVSAVDSRGKLRNMRVVLKELHVALATKGEGEQIGFKKAIAGAEASSALSELVKQAGTGGLDQYFKKVNTVSDDFAQQMAKRQADNVTGAFKGFGSALQGLAISSTSAFLPTLQMAVSGLTLLTRGIEEITQVAPWLTTTISGAVIGFTALKLTSIGTKYALTSISDGLETTRRAFIFLRNPMASTNFLLKKQKAGLAFNTMKMKAQAVVIRTWTIAKRTAYGVTRLFTISLYQQAGAMARIGLATGAAKLKVIGLATANGLLALACGKLNIASRLVAVGFRVMKFALVSTGIGAIAVGIGMAAAWIWKNWEPLKGFFIGFAKGISDGFAPVLTMFPVIGKAFNWLGEIVKPVFNWFKSLFIQVDKTSEKVKQFANLGERVGKWIGSLFGLLDTEEEEGKEKKKGNASPKKQSVQLTPPEKDPVVLGQELAISKLDTAETTRTPDFSSNKEGISSQNGAGMQFYFGDIVIQTADTPENGDFSTLKERIQAAVNDAIASVQFDKQNRSLADIY